MSVWVCIPSIRPASVAQQTVDKWSDMGYKVAVYRCGPPLGADLHLVQPSPHNTGWANQVNTLVWHVLAHDKKAEWFVAGSDDIDPDPKVEAGEIASSLRDYFSGSTIAVMQPTGDRGNGGIIDTAAASAWMGREFCQSVNQGNGPLWSGYRFYWADRELQEVATKLGVFLQRPDLTQLHNHWSRSSPTPPDHLKEALANFAKYGRLFQARKAAGFPGSELLP